MNNVLRSNLRFAMKQAHSNTQYLINIAKEKGIEDIDYRATFALCLKNVLKVIYAKKTTVKKAFGSAMATAEQKQTIATMRNVLGNEWDGSRGARLKTISKHQAAIEINRNMEKYIAQKDLGFCLVDAYQQLIAIKQAFCKLKGIPFSMADRRSISQEDATKWIKEFSRFV